MTSELLTERERTLLEEIEHDPDVTQASLAGGSQIRLTIVAPVTATVSGTQIANTGYVVSAEDAASDTVTVTEKVSWYHHVPGNFSP